MIDLTACIVDKKAQADPKRNDVIKQTEKQEPDHGLFRRDANGSNPIIMKTSNEPRPPGTIEMIPNTDPVKYNAKTAA